LTGPEHRGPERAADATSRPLGGLMLYIAVVIRQEVLLLLLLVIADVCALHSRG
jgi:hypothetical protein